MRAAVNLVFTLCALLTLRAFVHCYENPHENDETNCDNKLPTIGIICRYDDTSDYPFFSEIYDSPHKMKNKVSVPFGASVNVWCSEAIPHAKRLIMRRDGQKLVTKKYPDTIVWSTGKLDLLKSEYEYECTDVETTCKRSVITLVTPGLEVISANVQITDDKGQTNYIVQYGESMTVLCFGPDAARLVMLQDGVTLLTERENDAAIKHSVRKPLDLQISELVCTDVNTTYNRSVTIRVVPTVYFQSRNETITPNHMYFDNRHGDSFVYYFDYSSSIEVYCTGPRPVKLKEHGDEDIPFSTETCNSNTVKYIKKIKLGRSDFRCTDSEFADYVIRVGVIIQPRMEVKSPNILRVGSRRGIIRYAIKHGAPLEIICSETDSAQLRIQYKYLEDCQEQVVNETAIKCIVEEVNTEEDMFIDCYRLSDSYEDEPARVQVGVLPEDVVDFHCVSHSLQYLNCSWTPPTLRNSFTLSYIENGIATHMCELRSSPRKFKVCIWDYDDEFKRNEMEVFTLTLKSCNNVGCSNQTFNIEHVSILKPAPPQGLKVVSTTARGAVLQWYAGLIRIAGEYLYLETGSLQYKVQYQYSSIEPREVNSSLATCEFSYCRIELNLPCPGQFYQVWINHKPRGAVREEIWSDSTSVSFHTAVIENVKKNAMNDDPTCSWKPRKTAEVMKYLVQARRQDVHLDMQMLKEKITSLKERIATIRTYLEQRRKDTL